MNNSELLETAKPILFNTEMVGAILDGRKTVTRRVINEKDVRNILQSGVRESNPMVPDNRLIRLLCIPRYDIGDILYVRETWSPVLVKPKRYLYKTHCPEAENLSLRWHPSIHMPKTASRIFLRVTGVRVERLRDITLKDMKAEGLKTKSAGEMCKSCLISENEKCKESFCEITFTNEYSNDFACLWDSTIKEQDLETYGWNANPWVWVIEFERIETDG